MVYLRLGKTKLADGWHIGTKWRVWRYSFEYKSTFNGTCVGK